jgi:hypothetical protein
MDVKGSTMSREGRLAITFSIAAPPPPHNSVCVSVCVYCQIGSRRSLLVQLCL